MQGRSLILVNPHQEHVNLLLILLSTSFNGSTRRARPTSSLPSVAAFEKTDVAGPQAVNMIGSTRAQSASHSAVNYLRLGLVALPSSSKSLIRLRNEFSSSNLGSPPAPPLVARIIPARSMTTICGMFKISFPVRPR